VAAVLVIDDDAGFCRMLRSMLEDEGHEVETAADGFEGISYFSRHRPDVVITDMIMPHFDGIETISVLRGVDPSVPIIAITGGSENLLKMAEINGAAATLAKPLSPSALLTALLAVIGSSGLPN
jgi:CheY-like chemotaxis protein